MGVSSPARCSLASIKASRRSVFTRSPAFIGISDGAVMPTAGQQAVQPVPAGASLVAEAEAAVPVAQPPHQLAQNLGAVLENAKLADLAASATLGNRHRRLVHIQSNVRDRVHPARLPCMRLCAGQPTQP